MLETHIFSQSVTSAWAVCKKIPESDAGVLVCYATRDDPLHFEGVIPDSFDIPCHVYP